MAEATQAMRRIALVTGGNRGIGYEICRALARQGMQVVMTARDEAELRRAQARLATEGLAVDCIELDVADPRMVEPTKGENIDGSFIGDWVQRKYGRLDVLVNNAGVVPDKEEHGVSSDSILKTAKAAFEQGFETHLYGPIALCRAFVPMMRAQNYGRIVNLSTSMARLSDMGTGWPAYRVSKVALNAFTKLLAEEVKGTNILVNAASPGWVNTRMGGKEAPLTPEQGADTPVWLATLPDGGPSGGFFADRKPTAW